MVSTAAKGVLAVLLLCGSNAFMTTAWYLHLKFKSWPLVKAIFISWLIAFFEYCLQVPGNRLGHFSNGGPFTAPQLKIIQEFISLTAFAIFSVLVLKEKLRWVDLGAFLLILAGVAVGMVGKPPDQQALPPPPQQPVAPAQAPAEEGGRRLLRSQVQLPPHKAGTSSDGSDQGAGSSAQGSPMAQLAGTPTGALHAVHELHSTPSARVLVADDADPHAGSNQQGVRRREATVPDDEETGAGRSRVAHTQHERSDVPESS